MNRKWLSHLCDPLDKSDLSIQGVTREENGDILEGTLASDSGHVYRIREGIPMFVVRGMQSLASVKSFAFEWNEFGFRYARDGWINDIVNPLVGGCEFFAGKIIVDAGAGSGAQSRWMAESGAKLVFSLELSDAIFSRHRETTSGLEDIILPIQCDIAFPPLRILPDVIYCINVLQHTANPSLTFVKLASFVGVDTAFLFNIYTKRSEAKFQIVRKVRQLIRHLPFKLWKWIAFLITSFAYPLSRVPFLLKPIRVVVPMSHSFRETWLDVYDAFGGHHFQENMTRSDQLKMIQDAGLDVLREATFGYVVTRNKRSLKPTSGTV